MSDELDIDLRSDTVTAPSAEMREAAATAEVGDDVYRDDPTVNELERRAAEAVGAESALYVPSGTMANQIAVHVHTEPGQELLLERESHIYRWELAGAAKLSGVQTRTIDAGERCVPTPEAVAEGLVDEDLHRPGTGLLSLENTHNYRGGTAIPVDRIAAAAAAAHESDVPVHLDGARVFNAAVALGVDASEIVSPVDSVTFCLSKGLGAPVGSILAGDEAFVEDARRVRKLFGGGMRQAGMIAAPGLMALENVDRLAEDPGARVLVLTGGGEKCFSAGFDVSDSENMAVTSPMGRALWTRIDNFPKPIIAAINGHAMGGGLELALCCHFRMAADKPGLKLGLTEL
ncbi:MAG: GntG family PLP-dependent aldolase, partial [Halorubrum sp.]